MNRVLVDLVQPLTRKGSILPMTNPDKLLQFTTSLRAALANRLRDVPADKFDAVPVGWNSTLRWQVGHLVVTPRRLTFLLLGEPLGLPEDYNRWFAKDSSPAKWGSDPVPSATQLLDLMESDIRVVFEQLRPRWDEPFANPYTTSSGAVLSTPGEALCFSLVHDGIHLGLVRGTLRALGLL